MTDTTMIEGGTLPTDQAEQTVNYLSKGQRVHIVTIGNAIRSDNILGILIKT